MQQRPSTSSSLGCNSNVSEKNEVNYSRVLLEQEIHIAKAGSAQPQLLVVARSSIEHIQLLCHQGIIVDLEDHVLYLRSFDDSIGSLQELQVVGIIYFRMSTTCIRTSERTIRRFLRSHRRSNLSLPYMDLYRRMETIPSPKGNLHPRLSSFPSLGKVRTHTRHFHPKQAPK